MLRVRCRTVKSAFTRADRPDSVIHLPTRNATMRPLNLSLAHAVRGLRSASGFSQEAFAAKVGIHRTFMSSIERGKTNVSLETLERLAAGLDMHVWQLIRRAETDPGLYGKVAEPRVR